MLYANIAHMQETDDPFLTRFASKCIYILRAVISAYCAVMKTGSTTTKRAFTQMLPNIF